MKSEIYWLNKDSRKFLERGYLLEGESAEVRIRDISEKAEKYLKKGRAVGGDKIARDVNLGPKAIMHSLVDDNINKKQ